MRAPVIEVLGVPGSGKSGLATALAEGLGAVVVKDHTTRDLPALAAAATRSTSALLAAPPPGTARSRWAAWVARVTAAPAVAARRGARHRLVVFDQGPAYTLGRLRDIRRDPRGSRWWYRQLCATARLLDVLVVLDADPDVLARRLRERAKEHHAAHLDDAALLGYLDAERQVCHTVADALGRAGAPVLHLDSGCLGITDQAGVVQAALASRPVRARSR